MIIEPVSMVTQSLEMNIQSIESKNVSNSSNVFLASIQNLDSATKQADQAIADYIFKKNLNTHELMITLESAKHTLQLAVEIRNKMVEAYESVTRMRI